ncbi:MAG TPA: hypothetical protein VD816_01930 [Ohtaekwangia sp.]|nr:hypothetical protein [Ohtaekwangia sp.]
MFSEAVSCGLGVIVANDLFNVEILGIKHNGVGAIGYFNSPRGNCPDDFFIHVN